MLDIQELILQTSKKLKADINNGALKLRLETIKAIKTERDAIMKAKNAPKEWSESLEMGMLRKMVKERVDNVALYKSQNREDLAEKEAAEAEVLKEMLPPEVDENVLIAAVKEVISAGNDNIGKCMVILSKSFPTADKGKLSQIIKAHL